MLLVLIPAISWTSHRLSFFIHCDSWGEVLPLITFCTSSIFNLTKLWIFNEIHANLNEIHFHFITKLGLIVITLLVVIWGAHMVVTEPAEVGKRVSGGARTIKRLSLHCSLKHSVSLVSPSVSLCWFVDGGWRTSSGRRMERGSDWILNSPCLSPANTCNAKILKRCSLHFLHTPAAPSKQPGSLSFCLSFLMALLCRYE